MSAAYTNKFTVEAGDVVRLVFIDERAPVAQGLPMASSTAAEVVMTRANAEGLRDLLAKVLPR